MQRSLQTSACVAVLCFCRCASDDNPAASDTSAATDVPIATDTAAPSSDVPGVTDTSVGSETGIGPLELIGACSVDVHQHFAGNLSFDVGVSSLLAKMDDGTVGLVGIHAPDFFRPDSFPRSAPKPGVFTPPDLMTNCFSQGPHRRGAQAFDGSSEKSTVPGS